MHALPEQDVPAEPSGIIERTPNIQEPSPWTRDRRMRSNPVVSHGPRRILQSEYIPRQANHLYTPTTHADPDNMRLGTPLHTVSPQPAQPNLSESIHAIQVSLTALHERLSALEHLHTRTVQKSENPWTFLLRGMGILSSPRTEQGVNRGWILKLLIRLLSTVRRAVIDVSFVLFCLCLFSAGRAAVRRRLRFSTWAEEGGRKAVRDFVGGVAEMAGRVWKS